MIGLEDLPIKKGKAVGFNNLINKRWEGLIHLGYPVKFIINRN